MRRFILVVPMTALLLMLALSDSSAQAPGRAKDRAAIGGLEFQVYTDAGGKFRYRLVEGDVNLGGSAKGYDTLGEVRKIIKQIQDGAAKAKITQVKNGDSE